MFQAIKQYIQLKKLLKIVEQRYFESGDFNGTAIFALADRFDVSADSFQNMVRHAIETERLTASLYINPHILGFTHYTTAEVLQWFDNANFPSICLYPHRSQLANSKYLNDYEGAPYVKELAMGAGQVDFRAFDVSVLEYYRNDPRFFYWTDDIGGQIEIDGEYYRDQGIPERDKILLKTFGFAYDEELNRYVAVFLRYLSDLTPEHQNVWLAKEVKGDLALHPDYYRRSIAGDFGVRISIFSAFIEELKVINEMCDLMGKPRLFRSSVRPQRFEFLLRPTLAEFNAFALLLDQMMSDNINKKFFQGDLELVREEERNDGKITVHQKGTIQLLEEWLNKFFRCGDEGAITDLVLAFRNVRKLRQKPAHTANEDGFDQEIFRQQRELMVQSYEAVNLIRLIFANHPAVRKSPPEINDYVAQGKIWDI